MSPRSTPRRSAVAAALATILCAACSREPEFFPLAGLEEKSVSSRDGVAFVAEQDHVVIANPPRDREALRKAVAAFNRRTLTGGALSSVSQYVRNFYRETTDTPRNYKPGNHGYFEHDRIEDHADDLLLFVRFRRGIDAPEYVFFENGSRVP
jgi:hypothetical protein